MTNLRKLQIAFVALMVAQFTRDYPTVDTILSVTIMGLLLAVLFSPVKED